MQIEDGCPACGSHQFEESFEQFDGFCEDCGFVIEDFANPNEPQAQVTQSEFDIPSATNDDSLEWEDFVSVRNSTEQQVAEAIDYIESMADELSFSNDTRKRSSELYCEAMFEGVTDGRSTKVLVASILHLVSRDNGEVRPVPTIASVIDEEETRIKRLIRTIQQELSLNTGIPEPSQYLPYFIDELDINQDVVQRCKEVLTQLSTESSLSGQNPAGLAGAVLYEVTDGSRTQREIAECAGVSKETIRQRLNDIRSSSSVSIDAVDEV